MDKVRSSLTITMSELETLAEDFYLTKLTKSPYSMFDPEDVIADFKYADTKLFGMGRDAMIEVVGVGTYGATTLNYIGVGMMAAHYGVGLIMGPMNVAWNYDDLGQVPGAQRWAVFGMGYYENR